MWELNQSDIKTFSMCLYVLFLYSFFVFVFSIKFPLADKFPFSSGLRSLHSHYIKEKKGQNLG